MITTACLLGALLGGCALAAPEPLVVKEWTFDRDVQGWTGANTTPLKAENGALVFSATGKDIFIVSPLFELRPEVGDVLEIRLKSTTEGTAEWFWRPTTEGPYAGFSPELRRSVALRAGDDWQVLRLQPLWQGPEKIVGLRFDPPEGLPGTYEVDAVRILRFPRGDAVRADFDFTTGDHGWVSTEGTATPTAQGLEVSLPTPDARLMSPALQVDPGATPWLELALTAPRTDGGRDDLPGAVSLLAGDSPEVHPMPLRLASGRRSRYFLRLPQLPEPAGPVTLLLGVTEGTPVTLTLHSLRAVVGPEAGALSGPATGYEFQTQPWRIEARLPAAPPRIDVATQAPPETHPVASDYTVAMWYFAAWEPEYTWDGWQQVAERAPWRIPLLYDSADAEMRFSGIQFYRASNPRVIDWHVHWMREHAINLMIWDWYPRRNQDGSFDPTFFGNRALEVGFLGKAAVGGPPVATNRFADTMPFAVMWTNHPPHNQLGEGLAGYTVDQFFSQPNYYRLDGKPLLVLWSVGDLVSGAGGEDQARAVLDDLRERAKARGLPGVYVAAVNGANVELNRRLGIDGVTGYHYPASGGRRVESRRLGDRTVQDFLEDYPTQTIPGHVKIWTDLADAYGREYLLATTPMQNWEPTFRGANIVMQRNTPDAYREMLRRAKALIEARGLRRFVNIEAWNEWLEGSYMEPSTQWGYEYLEAVRDVLGKAPEGGKQ